MKKPYSEGVAIHTDPEPCGAAREGGLEALVGACAGGLLSREIFRDRCFVDPMSKIKYSWQS